MTALPRRTLGAYAVVALPLSAGVLPLYIHVPSLYADSFGAQLAGIGLALLLARAADAFVDPWLGTLIDRLRRPRLLIFVGVALLAAGLVLVFHPPAAAHGNIAWLLLALVPAYIGYSLSAIAYLALGAGFGATSADRAGVAIWREGFGLAGILLAAAAPQLVPGDPARALGYAAVLFAVVAPVGVAIALRAVPPSDSAAVPIYGLQAIRSFLQAPFAPLLAAFGLNGIANALPATLVLFFVADVLGAPHLGPQFLLAYFAAGAIGLPAWLALARRMGTWRAWRLSMLLGAAAFAGTALLGAGDLLPFLAVCVLTGLMLGADLAFPAALLTDALRARRAEAQAASYFGVWTFATKMTAALAAGVGLPLVGALGYLPGQPDSALGLQAVYCLLPCALKVAAAGVLSLSVRVRTQGALS